MKEHKHAEVLRAIADGREVQMKKPNHDWLDNPCGEDNKNPINYPEYEWRIKPEPKPDYTKYLATNNDLTVCNNYSFVGSNSIFFVRGFDFAIKITFDGETNEPKSVELVK